MRKLMQRFGRKHVNSGDEKETTMYGRAETRIIVGLGNPGLKYARTRHNAGWMVIDEIARRAGGTTSKNRLHAEIIETHHLGYRLILAKPQTFMNDSGIAVRELLNWYKVTTDELMIVVDDLDISFGRLRVRSNGSAGGHNGLKSIIREIGTAEFPRLRFGIGRPRHEGGQAIGHVLSTFSKEESVHLPQAVEAAADALEMWMKDGLLSTMNATNGVPSGLKESTGSE